MLDKALGVQPDAYVPDMEDSVPDSEKKSAREIIRSHLAGLSAKGPLVIPRVNALETGLTKEDLTAVVGPHIYGISIGKVCTVDDIHEITVLMEDLEQKAGLELGKIKLIPWIETALAMVHCYEICNSSPRIEAVAFGAEDFTNDMEIERMEDESQLAYARSKVCIAARAANVVAFDTPYFRFKDQDGLRQNVNAAKRCGFKGKFAIHPAQIEPINTEFSPSAEEIKYAQRVVAAFEVAERSGRGSTSLEGKVIDVPVVKRARAILQFTKGHL